MGYNLLSIFNGKDVLNASDTAYVCLMGIGIVFVGLVMIVILCTVMSALFKKFAKDAPNAVSAPVAVQAANEPIANKQEFIAAVSAAVAEEMGTDISAIRIKSIKRI